MTEERCCAMCGKTVGVCTRCGLCVDCEIDCVDEDNVFPCAPDYVIDEELARYRSLPSFTGRAT